MKLGEVRYQEFATPDFSVRPKASAVEGDADYLAAEMVFRHAACDVGMMVLNSERFLFNRSTRARDGCSSSRDADRRATARGRDTEGDAERRARVSSKNCIVSEVFQVTDVLA